MNKKNGFLVWIISTIIIIFLIFAVFYFIRSDKKNKFDKLLNEPYYLRVNFGASSKVNTLKDVSPFLKETNIERNYYLYITKTNIIFAYYTDYYYIFDPLHGYHIDFEANSTNENIQNILNEINQIKVSTLTNKNESEYSEIRINNENGFINTNDLLLILQKYNYFVEI